MPNSTAHIVIQDSPRPAANVEGTPHLVRNAPADQVNAIFDGIDDLLKASAGGIALITACILNGMKYRNAYRRRCQAQKVQ